MRAILWAALSSMVVITPALADASVAGHWRMNMGSGVAMTMDVTPDGNWSSETRQHNHVVRHLRGTYEQTNAAHDKGTIVFKPSHASARQGSAETETDTYELTRHGKELRLTSEGDTMVFTKH